jgi:virginiamycin B lyase
MDCLWGRSAPPGGGKHVVARRLTTASGGQTLRRLGGFAALVVLLPALSLSLLLSSASAVGAGQVTSYLGISGPGWIAVGPNADLWFTNETNNTIGRVTSTGKITNFSGVGIDFPRAIVAGADGAMWFTAVGDRA